MLSWDGCYDELVKLVCALRAVEAGEVAMRTVHNLWRPGRAVLSGPCTTSQYQPWAGQGRFNRVALCAHTCGARPLCEGLAVAQVLLLDSVVTACWYMNGEARDLVAQVSHEKGGLRCWPSWAHAFVEFMSTTVVLLWLLVERFTGFVSGLDRCMSVVPAVSFGVRRLESVAPGSLQVAADSWVLAQCKWLQTVGYWLSASGCRQLVYCLFVLCRLASWQYLVLRTH